MKSILAGIVPVIFGIGGFASLLQDPHAVRDFGIPIVGLVGFAAGIIVFSVLVVLGFALIFTGLRSLRRQR